MSLRSGRRQMELTSSDVRAIVLSCESNESSPSTSNIQHLVSGLQVQLFAHHRHFVVLQLLKSLHTIDVLDDTGSVDHARTKEPRIKVVSSVVVVTDLLLVLGLRMDDDLGNQIGEDVFEELYCQICFGARHRHTAGVNSKVAQSWRYSITSNTSPLNSTFPSK